jgi:hypothetical protein
MVKALAASQATTSFRCYATAPEKGTEKPGEFRKNVWKHLGKKVNVYKIMDV